MGSHRREAPPPGPYPWLVYFHGKGFKDQTFCSDIYPSSCSKPEAVKTYRKKIPALKDETWIMCCSHGWLIFFYYDENRFSLCNASTFQTIDLPQANFLDSRRKKLGSCLLTSPPDSPDSKVLVFFENHPSIMVCKVWNQEKEKSWTEIGYGNQLRKIGKLKNDVTAYFWKPVLCGGKIFSQLYVADHVEGNRVCSIQLSEKDDAFGVELTVSDNSPVRLGRSYTFGIMPSRLESGGELFDVGIGIDPVRKDEVVVVDVSRFNSETMIWERVDRLEGRSFFLGHNYCLSCPVPGPGYIYFTYEKDPSLYCYSMDEDSISVFMPCPNLPTPWCSPLWIMHEFSSRTKGSDELSNIMPEEDESQLNNRDEDDARKDHPLLLVEEKQLDNLAFDVLQEVSKHLMCLDYMSFRATSRICRSATPLKDWRMEFSKSQTVLSSPLLMFADNLRGGNNVFQFVDPRLDDNEMRDHSYKIKAPDSLNDTIIRYSNHGWVLLSRNDSIFVYNPFTKDVAQPCPDDFGNESIFFTSKPMKDRSFLIGISCPLHTCYVISKVHPEEDRWHYHQFGCGSGFMECNCHPVFFQNAFFYLVHKGHLAALKVEEGHQLTFQVFDKPDGFVSEDGPCKSFRHRYLVECGGELMSVLVGPFGRWVRIYKLSQCKKIWENVGSLGNYNLYLSRSSSFAVAESHETKKNRIYFARFRGKGIVFYSLDTGKWHSSGSQEPSENLYGTRLMLNSCWIQPSWC